MKLVQLARSTRPRLLLPVCLLALSGVSAPFAAAAQTGAASPVVAITTTSPSPLTEKNLHGAKVVVSLTGVAFVAGIPDPDHFELATVEASGVAVDGVERILDDVTGRYRRDRVEVRLRYDGTDFDTDGTLAVTVKAAAHGGGADLTTGTVPVTAVQEAADATLESLAISPGTLSPVFAGGTTAYTATVAATVTALTVTATASDTNASVTVNGRAVTSGRASHAVALAAAGSATVVAIVVTAEDGTTGRTYTVTVNRAAGAAPSAAVVSTDPSSLTEKNLHGAKVVVSLTGVVFVAGIPDPDHFELATVEASGVAVDGVERIPDYRDRVEVRLRYDGTDFDTDGTLAVTVKAAAHGGGGDLTTGTVPVTAVQEAADATLESLAISPGTLSPVFAGGTTAYTATVAATVTALTVTATASDTNASVTVNGRAVTGGRASHAVALAAAGSATVVAIVVTAEDGTTGRTYTVTVSRAAGTAPSAAVVSTDPSSLTEKNLHGAKVVVSLTGVVFVAGIPDPDHFELATVEASGVAVDGVERIPDYRDRVEVRLRYDGTDFDTDGTLAVTVKAAAHGGGGDLTTVPVPVTAVQEAADATLESLAISPGTLSPAFAGGTTTYTATVAATVTALTVTATPRDDDASITVTANGRAVTGGRASHAVALDAAGGSTVVTIVVTAEDGTTTKTYKVTVKRATADINQDGCVDEDDVLVMYYAYTAPGLLNRSRLRRLVLRPLLGRGSSSSKLEDTDSDYMTMLSNANDWQNNPSAGGDVNQDDLVDEDDVLVMYYAYTAPGLLNRSRLRRLVLRPLLGRGSSSRKVKDTDDGYMTMLSNANALRTSPCPQRPPPGP